MTADIKAAFIIQVFGQVFVTLKDAATNFAQTVFQPHKNVLTAMCVVVQQLY